jgi:DNA-binding XRE family transcriptional regulator
MQLHILSRTGSEPITIGSSVITAKVIKNFGHADDTPHSQVMGWATVVVPAALKSVQLATVQIKAAPQEDFVDIDAQVRAVRAKPGAAARLPVALRRAGEMLYGNDLPTLKALRLRAGLSQEEFAARMRTSQATISKWERGLVDARASTMGKIADVLGVSIGLVAEVWCRSCKAEDAGNV